MTKKIRNSKVLDVSPLPPPLRLDNDLNFLVQQHSQFFDKLVEVIHLLAQQHSQFFGKLVEFIPARFCPPVEDQEERRIPDLSKDGKASTKKGSRKNIKKKSSGTLDLLKKNFEEEKEEEVEEENDVKNKNPLPKNLLTHEELRERFHRYLAGEVLDPPPFPADNQSQYWVHNLLGKPFRKPGLTYQEHRERFHRRLEEIRSTRTSEESNRMKKTNINQQFKGKRKREIEAEAVNAAVGKTQQDDSEAAEGLTTLGHVKIEDENKAGRKKRKLSKLQALERVKKRKIGKKEKKKLMRPGFHSHKEGFINES